MHLKRDLKLHHMFSLAVGNVIGVSWIVMLGVWIESAGSIGAMIAFLAGGLIIIMVGFCYAELSSAFPYSGGDIVYAYELFGAPTAFAIGWILVLIYLAVNTFLAVSAGWILSVLFPDFIGPSIYTAFGVRVSLLDLVSAEVGLILLAILNYRGARVAAQFQSVATYCLLAIATFFIGAGLIFGDTANLIPAYTSHGGSGSIYGIVLVMMTTPLWYAGFNVIPLAMGERADNTSVSNIALTLLLSIAAVMAFYVLLILSASMSLPRGELLANDLPAADAFQAVLGSTLMKKIVLVAGLLGLITSWNAQFFAGARALFALGRARLLPGFLAKVSGSHGTPVYAICALGVCSMLAALMGVGAITRIVNTGGICFSALFMMASIELLRLRHAMPGIECPYRAPYGTLVALMAGLSSTIMILTSVWETRPKGRNLFSVEWLIILGWMALGAIIWFATRRSRESISENYRKQVILDEDPA